jgi:hypothetical protein
MDVKYQKVGVEIAVWDTVLDTMSGFAVILGY